MTTKAYRPILWVPLVIVVCAALAYWVNEASAAQTRLLQGTFGCEAGPNCTTPAPAGSTLKEPSGIAVNTDASSPSFGDIYVADTGNHRVSEFDANGTFIRTFGKEVGHLGEDTCEFTCQPGKEGSGPGEFKTPQFIAVDNTPGAGEGDVYVADTGDNTVSKFSPEGVLESTWGTGGQLTGVNGTGTGTLTNESTTIKSVVTATGSFTPGQEITGTGILAGTTIANVLSSTELEISQPATTAGVGVSLTATKAFGAIAGIAVGPTGSPSPRALYVIEGGEGVVPTPVFEFEPDSTFKSEVGLEREVLPDGLGVNGEGDLFKVKVGNVILEYSPSGGEPVRRVTGGGSGVFTFGSEGGLYVAGLDGTLDHDEFSSGEVVNLDGSPCAAECSPTDSTPVGFVGSGVGVAASGDTFLSNATEGSVYRYAPAVTVPYAKTGEEAKAVEATTATFEGAIKSDGLPVTECVFEYGETTSYGETAACEYEVSSGHFTTDPGEIPVDSAEHPVRADVKGLAPGTTYHFRLSARNANDPGPGANPNPGAEATPFTTLPTPSIDSATVTALTASSATLNATINPKGFKTAYHFEYSTVPADLGTLQATVVGEGSLPAGEADVLVPPQNIAGLSANTQYYWRVVATSTTGTTTGAQHTFVYTTTSTGLDASALPDGRAYELVTPPRKNGSLVGDTSLLGLTPDLAASGERVMAIAIQCFAGALSCNAQHRQSIGSPYEFTRSGEAGVCAPAAPPCWHTTALAPPASTYYGNVAQAYDAQDGTALFSSPTAPLGENDFYLREPSGAFVDLGPETLPEDGAQGPLGGIQSDEEQVFTADLSRFAWDAPYAWSSPFAADTGVYEYAPGAENQHLDVAVAGGYEDGRNDNPVSDCGALLGPARSTSYAPGEMSADGRIVFFSASPGSNPPCGGALGPVPAVEVLARVDGESADAHTVAVSVSACGHSGGAGEVSCRTAENKPSGAWFSGASEDGADAFFTSTQQLTDGASEGSGDATAEHGCSEHVGASGCNLYMFEGVTAENASERHLLDVSEGEGVVAGGPRVQGVVAVSSQPASERVYFVAKGVLTARERPGCIAEWDAAGRTGEAVCHAVEGADNLYVYSRETHSVSFVTVMGPDDFDPTGGGSEWNEPGLPANVTPDGSYLVFLSHGDLTPDDTSRSGAEQVFRYDAQSGTLNRISIGNEGFDDDGNRSAPTPCEPNGAACAEQASIATASRASRSDPTMSDDGSRVFFQSPVALTPHALDDLQIGVTYSDPDGTRNPDPIAPGGYGAVYAQNVYEWEQAGVGSCPEGQSTGCTYLISDGRDVSVNTGPSKACPDDGSSVCLMGTDATGANVFITTADQLVSSDTNTEVDYYDARVCGGEDGPCVSSPPSSSACSGEECHGVPAGVPGVPGYPSQTFNGAGNITSTEAVTTVKKKTVKCKKGFVKNKKGKCVRNKKKKAKKARKASNDRRVSR